MYLPSLIVWVFTNSWHSSVLLLKVMGDNPCGKERRKPSTKSKQLWVNSSYLKEMRKHFVSTHESHSIILRQKLLTTLYAIFCLIRAYALGLYYTVTVNLCWARVFIILRVNTEKWFIYLIDVLHRTFRTFLYTK